MPWSSGEPPDNLGKKSLYSMPAVPRPKRPEHPRDRNRPLSQFQLESALHGRNNSDFYPSTRPPTPYRGTPSPDPMYTERVIPIDYDKVLLPKDQKRTIPACPPLSSTKGANFTSKYATAEKKILPRAGRENSNPEVTKVIWPSLTERRKPQLIEPNLKVLVDPPRGYKQDATGPRDVLRYTEPTPAPPKTPAQRYGYSPISEPLANMRKVMNTERDSGLPRGYPRYEEPTHASQFTPTQLYGGGPFNPKEPLPGIRKAMNATEGESDHDGCVENDKKLSRRFLKRRKQSNNVPSADSAPTISTSSYVTERPTSGRQSSPQPAVDSQRKSKSPDEEDAAKKSKKEEKKPKVGRKHTLAENKAWYAKFKANLAKSK